MKQGEVKIGQELLQPTLVNPANALWVRIILAPIFYRTRSLGNISIFLRWGQMLNPVHDDISFSCKIAEFHMYV